MCVGLSFARAVGGGTVYRLPKTRCMKNREMARHEYQRAWQNSDGHPKVSELCRSHWLDVKDNGYIYGGM